MPAETGACQPYLDRQLEIISPKVVATLGRFSFGKFFPGEAIGKARGKPRNWKGLTIYPMYHPAAALRNPNLKPALEKDFAGLRSLVEKAPQVGERPQEDESKQLSFF